MSVIKVRCKFMDDRNKLYQLFVIVFMLVLLTGGILIGMAASKENEPEISKEELIDEIVEEVKSKEVEISEEYEETEDVEIVYVDIYNDCNHSCENKSNEYGVNFEEIKQRELEKIQKENSGYKLVKDENGILMFEKEHDSKCENHYMLKLQNDTVVIFRYTKDGEYEIYQETDIAKDVLRPDLVYRLEEGIEAETVEELYMFLEELES